MKTYRGFDIVKKSANHYWIVGCGCVIGSAYSIQDAEEFIDYMIYEDIKKVYLLKYIKK